MHFAGNVGDPHEMRGPDPRELFASFPGRVAVPHDDLGLGPMATWQYEEVDDTLWALEAMYDRGADYLLVVKTVRSNEGLDPRGLPVENDSTQISNFLNRAEFRANPGQYGPGRHPDRSERLDRHQAVQEAVDRVLPEPVAVPCDGVPRQGTRINASGCSVVHLAWDDNTIWCTGRPETIARLTLRSATLDDFGTTSTE